MRHPALNRLGSGIAMQVFFSRITVGVVIASLSFTTATSHDLSETCALDLSV